MKQAKTFIAYIIILYACLFLIDYLKATIFLQYHHALLVKLKTIVLIVYGVLIMRITLLRSLFKFFLYCYGMLWGGYFLVKLISSIHYINSPTQSSIIENYFFYTQIETPLPFIIFWFVFYAYFKRKDTVMLV